MISFVNATLKSISFYDLSTIKKLLRKQGFVIVSCKDCNSIEELKILEMAKELGLGKPKNSTYNKHYFSEKILSDNGLNLITTKKDFKSKIDHKAFESQEGQDLHVDGTFLPTGTIKTVILYCKNPAIKGGENNLFNVIGALNDMREECISIEPFFNTKALRRVSKYKGVNEERIDSIIKYNEITQREEIRFADDITVTCLTGLIMLEGLKEVWNELLKYKENEDFYKTFKLEKDQMLIMDNCSLAHGRNSFIDTANSPRFLVRGVFRDIVK